MTDTAQLPRRTVDRRAHTLGTDTACFDSDRTYRYALTRTWGEGPRVVWVMLNPSTADAFAEDNTSRRCMSFTRRLVPEAGSLAVVNLYGLRATDPRSLWIHPDPIGPDNDYYLGSRATRARAVIAAWGTHGARNQRGQQVAGVLADAGITLYCLGITGNGQPKHPLYVPGSRALMPYRIGVGCDA